MIQSSFFGNSSLFCVNEGHYKNARLGKISGYCYFHIYSLVINSNGNSACGQASSAVTSGTWGGKKGSLKCGRPDLLSESCRRRETLCVDSLAKPLNTASHLLHTTGSMLWENSAPTRLWLLLSGRFLSSLDPLGACKKSFSAIWQPGVVWCKNMFINSHVFFPGSGLVQIFVV